MIKVGFCIAYDWNLLAYSIPPIYETAEQICLSLDKDRKSWAGHNFSWDELQFRAFINKIDPVGKIDIYEDNFHLPDLSPMQNEVRQRNKMAERMGTGGWHIQLDTDEYFIDFPGFVNYLKSKRFSRPVNICCPWITLFKKVDQGYLWIKNDDLDNQDIIAIATNSPEYQFGRRNGHFNVLTNYPLLHQSWARKPYEIAEKIKNWGHSTDFDIHKYFEFWEDLTATNYKKIHNFHPIVGPKWQKLEFQQGMNVLSLISAFTENKPIVFSRLKLWLLNSIWLSRGKKIISLLLGKIK